MYIVADAVSSNKHWPGRRRRETTGLLLQAKQAKSQAGAACFPVNPQLDRNFDSLNIKSMVLSVSPSVAKVKAHSHATHAAALPKGDSRNAARLDCKCQRAAQ